MSHFKEFSHPNSQPSAPIFRLLCQSNGHGEDIVAVRILQELQQHSAQLQLAALPLVGEGRAYTHWVFPLRQCKPCLRWLHLHGWAAAGEIWEWLTQLTLAQLEAVRSWASLVGRS